MLRCAIPASGPTPLRPYEMKKERQSYWRKRRRREEEEEEKTTLQSYGFKVSFTLFCQCSTATMVPGFEFAGAQLTIVSTARARLKYILLHYYLFLPFFLKRRTVKTIFRFAQDTVWVLPILNRGIAVFCIIY